MEYMKQAKKSILSLALALLTALAILPCTAQAAGKPVPSTNINSQEYEMGRRWADPIKSYLYTNPSGGLTRVEYIKGTVVVEDYSASFALLSSRAIPAELPLWGGFFSGANYNFLVFGQDNVEENNAKEVYRIVKYSKDWQRLGSDSLFGANTIHPFVGGSLRCAEYGDYLYIRTCHEMYTSKKDGLNHQASVMINVRQSNMKITDSLTEVSSVSRGYVSHSFNQFILIDQEGRIVTLDHGDAGDTRSAVLLRYYAKAGQDSFQEGRKIPLPDQPGWYITQYCERADLVAFPMAQEHYNDTGASLDGLAEIAGGYVAVYNFDGIASDLGVAARNVYLVFAGKDMSAGKTVQLSAGTDTSVAHLVPIGTGGGFVLWNTRRAKNWYTFTMDRTLYFAAYDAGGNVAVGAAAAPLSDCAPILWNGKVVWYVTDNSAPTFYTLGGTGLNAYAVSP